MPRMRHVRSIDSPLSPLLPPVPVRSSLFSCRLLVVVVAASCWCVPVQVDLLLGTWAERNVAGLSTADMDSYEDILNLETVDIFNFITGNADPPAFVDTPMLARLQVRECFGCWRALALVVLGIAFSEEKRSIASI